MKNHGELTADTVRALLLDRMEDEETARMIAEFVGANEGKPINKRRLPAGCELYRLDGVPELMVRGKDGLRVYWKIVEFNHTAPHVWPTRAEFEERNAPFYRGAARRNAARRAILDEPGGCERVAALFNATREAAAAYNAAREAAMSSMADTGQDYEIEGLTVGGRLTLRTY